jgi:adenylosuccinate lyase
MTESSQLLFALTALSPVDGRYQNRTTPLSNLFSEFGLIRFRVQVEIAWFLFLSNEPGIVELPVFSEQTQSFIKKIATDFSLADAARIKHIEKSTNHDLKAVEYFIKEKLSEKQALKAHLEFVHFACTSEDINNLAYALMLKDARETVLLPAMQAPINTLAEMALSHRETPMMSRTHGQPATPTSVGKELANVAYRLQRQVVQFANVSILGKINGAVGNYNAHISAYPKVDWQSVGERFVTSLDLTHNPYTTQIEPHDYVAELLHALMRYNTVLIDFTRDMWGYISLEYFIQRTKAGEVGSSTMPHKVNPIDFENAEGNLGIANALMDHLAAKLPISRFQRDLTDSTVLRNLGPCLGHELIALDALEKGLSKISANPLKMSAELDSNWALLAEPIQTVMRRYGLENPYEQLKALTRGQTITTESIESFVAKLDLPPEPKAALQALCPAEYLGNASAQTQSLLAALDALKADTPTA